MFKILQKTFKTGIVTASSLKAPASDLEPYTSAGPKLRQAIHKTLGRSQLAPFEVRSRPLVAICVLAFAWTWQLQPGQGTAFAAICVLSGLAFGADLALPPALLARARLGDEAAESPVGLLELRRGYELAGRERRRGHAELLELVEQLPRAGRLG